jgi:hypothetical protein
MTAGPMWPAHAAQGGRGAFTWRVQWSAGSAAQWQGQGGAVIGPSVSWAQLTTGILWSRHRTVHMQVHMQLGQLYRMLAKCGTNYSRLRASVYTRTLRSSLEGKEGPAVLRKVANYPSTFPSTHGASADGCMGAAAGGCCHQLCG